MKECSEYFGQRKNERIFVLQELLNRQNQLVTMNKHWKIFSHIMRMDNMMKNQLFKEHTAW